MSKHLALLLALCVLFTGCGSRVAHDIAGKGHMADPLSNALVWLVVAAIVGCGVFAALMYFGAMVPGGTKACGAGMIGCITVAVLGVMFKALLPYALYGAVSLLVIAALYVYTHKKNVKAFLTK